MMECQYQRIPSHYSGDLVFALSLCLKSDPEKRPSIETLLGLPIFSKDHSQSYK